MHERVVGVAVVVSLFVGPLDQVRADEALETWYELQVDSVVVDGQRPGNAGTWDEAKQKDSGNGLCTLVVTAGAVATGVGAGAAKFAGPACGVLSFLAKKGAQEERDPKAPDLLLKLSADGVGTYWSGVAWDSYRNDFGTKFYVPASGIPNTGIKLSVVDQDGAAHGNGETIATFRLSKQDLESTAAASPPLKTFRDGGLKELELIVRPATFVPSTDSITVSSAAGLVPFAKQIPAGATVEVRAKGKYSLGGLAGSSEPDGINGYADYNFALLPKAKHGAAIAVISDPLMGAQAEPVGSCRRIIAAQSGRLALGVNDRKPENNKGDVLFTVSITPPTLDTWRKPGTVSSCAAPSSSSKPPADMKEALANLRAALAECGDRNAGKGKLLARVEVAPDGHVVRATISDAPNNGLRLCASVALRNSKFPAKTKAYTLSVPYGFGGD